MKKYIYFCLAVVLFTFTSTDIMAKRKKDKIEEVRLTPEEIFTEKNFIEKSCKEWEPGREFLYMSDELSLLLQPQDERLSDEHLSYKDKIFEFEGIEDEIILGQSRQVLLVFSCDGKRFRYKTGKSREEIENSSYKPLLPDMIALEYIEKARELLVGKTLYVRTTIWYDKNGNEIEGRKMIPVEITGVGAGNRILPFKFIFKDKTGKEGCVFGTLFTGTVSTQYTTFDRLFSFNNPREQYKNIPEDHWDVITQSKVMKGMTKEECRISLGLPNDVRRIPTYGGLKEQWLYNTGSYLFFEDGLLTDFRL